MLLETRKVHIYLFISACFPPSLLDVMIVSAFLQSPGLPLLGGGVIAVVMQQEGPHLATDGWVNSTKEDSLMSSERWTNTVSTKGVFSNVHRANGGHTVRDHFKIDTELSEHIIPYANKTCTVFCRWQSMHSAITLPNAVANGAKQKPHKQTQTLFYLHVQQKRCCFVSAFVCLLRKCLEQSLTATDSF